MGGTLDLEIRHNLKESYSDIYTKQALDALSALAPLNRDRLEILAARTELRLHRARARERITFLEPASVIPRTKLTVQDSREPAKPQAGHS